MEGGSDRVREREHMDGEIVIERERERERKMDGK